MEPTFSGVIIGALATLGLGVMTLIGVIWKSKSSDTAAYITTNAQLSQIVLDSIENVRRDLNAEIAEIKRSHQAVEKQLEIARESNEIMRKIIEKYVPAKVLEEISDVY